MGECGTETSTFLFTDIEGSTRRWDIDPESIRVALAAHDQVLRTAIEAHGGVAFKHTGDGVGAIFTSARAAIEAAADAQRKLDLPVRMGLASGPAEARDGDYFGPVVNTAARVMSAGHGGQILLAESTATLVTATDHLDLGLHVLRDIAEPMRLFQVIGAGLVDSFPRLHTLTAARGNLPASTSSFVGRHDQLEELVADLDDHRLVTLTGPGGVGKTRLAVEAAHSVVGDFPDGAWLVELASTNEAATVPALVANTFAITAQVGQSTTESILDALMGKRMLVVLDNCEHVVDAAGELAAALVRSNESVTVLATSREGLGIVGERLWPVRPFDVGAGLQSDGVALFLERARAVNPEFTLADGSDDLDAIVAVCRGLDGLPLAIELAAARMVAMSPQELLARLDDRFRLLGSPRRASSQRTLRDTVAWSYDLLDDDERDLLRRCAVFAAGFELDAVAAIGDERWDEYAVFDTLDSLVRKSLITARTGRTRTRYQLLETIRHFATERLDDANLGDTVRRMHATHFATQARTQWDVWNSPQQRAALDWVDTEFAELRAAFRWAATRDEIELATTIASHTTMLSFVLQRFEPVSWAVQIVDAATAADVAELPRLYTACSVGALTGAKHAAVMYAQTAVRLEADARYDGFRPGWSRYWEACAHRYSTGVEPYIEICDELAGHDDEFRRVVGTCGNFGVLAGVGRVDEAREMADETIEAARDYGVPFWISFAMTSWARAHATQDPSAALDMLRSSLDYTTTHRLDYIQAIVLREMAALQDSRGGGAEALEKFATVIEWYRSVGNHGSVATMLGDVAVMFDRLDRFETAATVYGMSIPRGQSIAVGLDETIERLRTQLGDEAFDACVTTGSTMGFNDAMDYVGRAVEDARARLAADE